MGKTTIFPLLVFLGVLGALAFDNREMVTLKIPLDETYEMSKVTLILFSTTPGSLVVFIGFLIRDAKRVIDNLQEQKRLKREAKTQEADSKAMNAILGHREEDAREALADILKESPEHVDALLRLGDIALHNDNHATALDYYKRARDLAPRNPQALLGLVGVHVRIKNWQGALRHVEEMLEVDSDNLTALYEKQAILESREKWDELISLQKTILKLETHEKEKQREERKLLGYKYGYACMSLENAELEKSEKEFHAILKLDSAFIPAYLGLAEVMVSLGEPGRLVRDYLSAVARKPEDKELKFLLGKVYSRLEMVDDALQILGTLDARAVGGTELFRIRGELYLKRGQEERALEEFRAACDSGNESIVSYCCEACGARANDWSGRCPQCSEWNTFHVDIPGRCPAVRPR